MCIEQLAGAYKNIISLFGTIGTVIAAGVAVYVIYKNSIQLKEIRLSGLSISTIGDDGVIFIENKTDIDLHVTISINRDVVDELIEQTDYSSFCLKDNLFELEYKRIRSNDVLSKGESIPVHLKNFTAEKIYVALVALRIDFDTKNKLLSGKTKAYLFRYAGGLSKESKNLGETMHPFYKWVIECAKLK